MTRTPAEEQAADNKSAELLLNSPYRDKLTAYGLFTQQLQHSRKQLTNLIRARLGNPLVLDKNAPRLAGLAASTSRLRPTKLDQISALPLGGRISLDPWMGGVEMSKARPVALTTAREKLVFESTPVFPNITRMQYGGEIPRAPDALNEAP